CARDAAAVCISHVCFQAEVGIRASHVTGVQTCALPISHCGSRRGENPTASASVIAATAANITAPCFMPRRSFRFQRSRSLGQSADRKSTRLNSSHVKISYAVFCLKKKKNQMKRENTCIT